MSSLSFFSRALDARHRETENHRDPTHAQKAEEPWRSAQAPKRDGHNFK